METYYHHSSSSTTGAAQTSESSLHTVLRKQPAKPAWKNKKKPLAPPPLPSSSSSNRPKVYNVSPIDFRELVQRLTGSAPPPGNIKRITQQRLRSLAPAPLAKTEDTEISSSSPLELLPPPESGTTTNSFGFDFLSPTTSSFNWCSFLSPGTISGLEHSTVS